MISTRSKHGMNNTINIQINNSSSNISNIKPVTFPVNIRVDNHIRNDLNTLIQLGFGHTNKDLVSELVKTKISRLDSTQFKRFSRLKNILEKKIY